LWSKSEEYEDHNETKVEASLECAMNFANHLRWIHHAGAQFAGETLMGYMNNLKEEIEASKTPNGVFVQRDRFRPGDRVVLYDDLGATWNTLRVMVDMFHSKFDDVRVVAVVTPYVVVDTEGRLLGPPPIPEVRFAWTHTAAAAGCPRATPEHEAYGAKEYVYMSDPDTEAWIAARGRPVSGLTRRQFAYSSNVWFEPGRVRGKHVRVVVDTTNTETTLELLQMMLILHRHDAKSVTVVAPFIEHSTQERVESSADGRRQTLAQADTLLALLSPRGSGRRLLSFDMHDLHTMFSGDDVRNYSLMDRLLELYFEENPDAVPVFPDAGAAKRFGPMVAKYTNEPDVVFDKVRRGNERVLTTLRKDFKDGTVYVGIDDVVRGGATMKGVADALLERGASAVDVCFVHAPLEAMAGISMRGYRKVYYTDTVRTPCCDIPPRVSWLDAVDDEIFDPQ
jgi:phosphoribosylpyrophosphate synthetase